MHNYNFVNIKLKDKKNTNQLYFYFFDNKNIESKNLREIEEYKKFLTGKSGETITAIKDGKKRYITCLNKEKKLEKQIAVVVKEILATENSVQINIKDLDVNFKLLVSKLVFDNKNNCLLKTELEVIKEKTIFINCEENEDTQEQVYLGIALGKSQALVQELVNMPSNILTPKKLVQKAQDYVLNENLTKIKVNIYGKKYIKEQKMGAFLGVAKGSKEKPTLLVMEYNNGSKDSAPIVLVGKGLTFDAGGISLKPCNGMEAMKTDMAGAATVIGALAYAAQVGLQINLVGIAVCCENMPSGNAVKPGDVLYAMNGTSIEVIDTDAEGRLVLADALVYSQQFKGKYTIDMATLTGACVTALGNVHSGLFTQDKQLAQSLITAGNVMEDLVWQLPLTQEHEDMLHSNVADIANYCLGKGAGAQNGAVFLQRFAPKKGWAHLDIAGTSNSSATGATSRPLSLLTEFLEKEAKNEI